MFSVDNCIHVMYIIIYKDAKYIIFFWLEYLFTILR